MPTPSFDELLARARQIGEAEADRSNPSTGLLAAKGATEFVNNLLGSKVSEKRTTGGYLSPSGEFTNFDRPVTSGGTILDVLSQSMMPKGANQTVPQGAFPLTPEQAGEFGMKAALENIKDGFRMKTADLRAKAQQRTTGMRVSAASQPMVREASDYVWALIGRDPESERLPILTFGDADRMLRAKGIDTSAELKGLGYEISLFKDPLFGIPEAERGRLQGKLNNRGKNNLMNKNYQSVQEAVADGKKSGDVVTLNGEKVKLGD